MTVEPDDLPQINSHEWATFEGGSLDGEQRLIRVPTERYVLIPTGEEWVYVDGRFQLDAEASS